MSNVMQWAQQIGEFSVSDLSKEDLLEMYANAMATTSCLGHTKGAENERLMRTYAREMDKQAIDYSKVTSADGSFNGRGSF